jgi:hypothetical protein
VSLEVGHALITMVEPDRETVAAYNRWYETDHFLSGVLTGPGAYVGRRFVATRALKDRRRPADSPVARPADDGSFVTLYWIERDQLGAHCDWGFPEAARLAGLGRMDTRRHHVSTDYYDLVDDRARPDHPVPVELALHHPYPGLVLVWTGGPEGRDAGFRERATVAGSPVARVTSWRPAVLDVAMPGAVMGDPGADVRVHACFVDAPVDADGGGAWDDVLAGIGDALGRAEPWLVAPFVPTVPGTEEHLDRLWSVTP